MNYVQVNMPDGTIALAKRIPTQQEQILAAREALNTEMHRNSVRIRDPLTSHNERMELRRRNDDIMDELGYGSEHEM